MYLLRISESNPAGGACLDVIWDGLCECVACVVVVDIEINVLQGANFNTENLKMVLIYDGRWQIAWCTKVVENERKRSYFPNCYKYTVFEAREEGEIGCRFVHSITTF